MAWISRIRALFGREKLAREQDEELEFHLSMREQLNVEQGMTQAEARRDARRRFGNPSLWRERMSEIDLMILPQTVLLDLRYGARILWRNMGFTIAAVLALAIGIGVNTAAFTAYKAFFKRSLDARESGRMVNLALMLHSGSGDQAVNPLAFFSIPDYEAYRDHLHSFRRTDCRQQPAEPYAYRSGRSCEPAQLFGWVAGGKAGTASERQQHGDCQHVSGLGKLFFSSRGWGIARPDLCGWRVCKAFRIAIGADQRELLAEAVWRRSGDTRQDHPSEWNRLYDRGDHTAQLCGYECGST